MTRHTNISYPHPTIKAALGGGLRITSDTAQFAVNVRRSLDWTKYQRTYRIWALDASDSQLKLLIYFDYIRAIRCHTLSPRPIRAEE